MRKLTIAICILLLLAIVPASVLASVPVFYCSPTGTADGDGSYEEPWKCSTTDELTLVVNEVCKSEYAILYQEVTDGYYRHVVEDPNDAACQVTSSVFYYGVPPDTGVSLPAPVVIGGALAVGAMLLAGGFVLYRKRYA